MSAMMTPCKNLRGCRGEVLERFGKFGVTVGDFVVSVGNYEWGV